MALAYLNENATSAAAANWSDATGFADSATLVLGNSNGSDVVSDVDQSGLTTGLESFEIQATFNANAGQAGTPFIFDADASADAFVRHGGPRRFYYSAAGGSSNCNFLYQTGTGATYLEGGTIDNARVRAGELYANASTVITNATIWGGRGTVENNATGFTDYTQKGGSFTVKRDGTFVVEGGTLVLDIPDTSPTISLTIKQGARVVVLQANTIATVYNDGVLDISRAKRPITLGASNHEQGPYARLVRGSLNHTITEPTYPAGFYSDGDLATGGI